MNRSDRVVKVLRLYRDLMKASNTLQYTDKDFYRRTVRLKFRETPTDYEDFKQRYKAGVTFLGNGLGGLK